jgi:hypothetical protein
MTELTGTDNQALLQALRNLWPLLSPTGRQHATHTANQLTTQTR